MTLEVELSGVSAVCADQATAEDGDKPFSRAEARAW